MVSKPALASELAQLQQQHSALLADFAALKLENHRKACETIAWLDQCTHALRLEVEDLEKTAPLQPLLRMTSKGPLEINSMKARLISVASHEFRTPLAIILSSAELLKDYGARLPDSEKLDVIGAIETGVSKMTQLLDRVFLLGKDNLPELDYGTYPDH